MVQERARLRDAQGFVTLRRGDSDLTTLNRDRPERLDKAKVALVSVVVSFPSVLDRPQPFGHRSGERDGRVDAPGGRPSDDLLSGLGPQTFAPHHPRTVVSQSRHKEWSGL